jgi:multimeric flavodoxin WrbA
MKITDNMIATAYKYAKLLYEDHIGWIDAKERIGKESGMNEGSALDYLYIFQNMMNGNVFKRAMSIESHRFFLDNIRKDYGEPHFQNALQAVEEHAKYYASLGRGHLLGVENLINEYKQYTKQEPKTSKKVLILNASPRKNGNTAFAVGKAAEGVRSAHPDAEIEVVRLHGLKIAPCRACDVCRRAERLGQYCIVNDDMAGLYGKVVEADAIILASPIYWFTMAAQLKLFMDRLYGLWIERTKSLEGKLVGALFVYGDADPYSSGAVNAFGTMQSFWNYTGAKPAGIAYGSANDIGDAAKNAALTERAFLLGRDLLQ